MKNAPPIPDFVAEQFGGRRKFRAHHREHLKRAARELAQASRGCAHSPAYAAVKRAQEALKEAIEAVRVRNWERRRSRQPQEPKP